MKDKNTIRVFVGDVLENNVTMVLTLPGAEVANQINTLLRAFRKKTISQPEYLQSIMTLFKIYVKDTVEELLENLAPDK